MKSDGGATGAEVSVSGMGVKRPDYRKASHGNTEAQKH
jgi:hypothetical protein